MNYQETLTFLFERLPMFQRIGKAAFKKDLSNTIEMCKILGNPENQFKSIHVAGTNGKGSTAHSLASVLQESNYKTGLYTSPHLKSFTERIKVEGQEVSESYIVDFVEKHRQMIEDIKPSFFEITVVMAFDYFAKEEVDIAIIEVGMGGRFDSTNVITPILSVITSIGMDHMEYLGNDLKSIAFEKAGIIKRHVPVVISSTQEEIKDVFINKAEQEKAELYFAEDYINLESKGNGLYAWNSGSHNFEFKYDLKGDYQISNLPGILQGIALIKQEYSKITDDSLISGLEHVIKNTGLKGRWQTLNKEPLVICDTGHNSDGIKKIIEQIGKYHYKKLIAVLGFANDKDIKSILTQWPPNAKFIFCQAKIPRAMTVQNIGKIAKAMDLNFDLIEDVNEAILKAYTYASKDDFIFIGGSTFVVAEIEDL